MSCEDPGGADGCGVGVVGAGELGVDLTVGGGQRPGELAGPRGPGQERVDLGLVQHRVLVDELVHVGEVGDVLVGLVAPGRGRAGRRVAHSCCVGAHWGCSMSSSQNGLSSPSGGSCEVGPGVAFFGGGGRVGEQGDAPQEGLAGVGVVGGWRVGGEQVLDVLASGDGVVDDGDEGGPPAGLA